MVWSVFVKDMILDYKFNVTLKVNLQIITYQHAQKDMNIWRQYGSMPVIPRLGFVFDKAIMPNVSLKLWFLLILEKCLGWVLEIIPLTQTWVFIDKMRSHMLALLCIWALAGHNQDLIILHIMDMLDWTIPSENYVFIKYAGNLMSLLWASWMPTKQQKYWKAVKL